MFSSGICLRIPISVKYDHRVSSLKIHSNASSTDANTTLAIVSTIETDQHKYLGKHFYLFFIFDKYASYFLFPALENSKSAKLDRKEIALMQQDQELNV